MTASDSRAWLRREGARQHPVVFALEFFFVFVGVGSVFEYAWGLLAGKAPSPLVGGDMLVAAVAAVLFTLAWRQWPRANAQSASGAGRRRSGVPGARRDWRTRRPCLR